MIEWMERYFLERTYSLPAAERSRPLGLVAALLPLAIFVVALIPRVLDLGRFATMDEVNFWFTRSETFLSAIQAGNFAGTAITDHPGVTTMWLGAFGILLRNAMGDAGMLPAITPQHYVAFFQLFPAIVNALAVSVAYVQLRGVLPRGVALMGALLWALDPFVIAYSRVLHVDALSGTFMTLGIIAACRYWFYAPRKADLILSGVFAGLAVDTKSPGLIMGPAVAAIALWAAYGCGQKRRFRDLALELVWWGAAMVATAMVVWPALWAAPMAAFEQIRIGYTAEGTQPHQLGNFFLGRSDPAPGLLFYPVAIALRLTPITTVGLLALPFAWRKLAMPPHAQRTLAGLSWFAVLFALAMSLFAKKFNRYVEPSFPAIDVLAALGLCWLLGQLLPDLLARLTRRRVAALGPAALGAVALGAALNVASWHPYQIAAFNQLLGGAKAGAWAFKTGWGEGMDLAAAWLNEQKDITGVRVVTTLKTGLQLYLRDGAQSLEPNIGPLPPQSGYVVVYVNDAQIGPLLPPFDEFYGKAEPLKVIQIHGVDYAWIYEAPPTVDYRKPAQFTGGGWLYGIRSPKQRTVGTTFTWTLVWHSAHVARSDVMLFAHVIGPDGQRYAQADVPFPPEGSTPDRYSEMQIPLKVPEDAPPGSYRLVVGMYGPDGQRLPLTGMQPADPALDGPDALLLDSIVLDAMP
ncbi:phospholipid carrier-dependent glycosyltransferase [Chloroflexia bacterium SDU3-3]|nr:phospholipid carrier-dependent glycosyltransferase [Chloroflexia bacterium SDU3-3]